MNVKNYDFAVIGAGIVGLTVSWELVKKFPNSKIIILEKESSIGQHASGRNSGVLHSGIYYGSDTLKAQYCASGSKKMQCFADEHKINYQRNGKIIIATSDKDLLTLDSLLTNAKENGINAEKVNHQQIKEIEPYASPHEFGIYTPETAVIDSQEVLEKFRSLLTAKKVTFQHNFEIIGQNKEEQTIWSLNKKISYGHLFNCAGAHADNIAKMFNLGEEYTLVPFKGIYYKLASDRNYLVRSNIYPVPDTEVPFLGVHLTKVINGDIYVGPTAIPALGRENYGYLKGIQLSEAYCVTTQLIKMFHKNKQNFRSLVYSELRKYFKSWFYKSAKELVSSLKQTDLLASEKVGIRPQLVNTRTQKIEMDFIIEQDMHTTHVLNSISPAFTSSLALSEVIVRKANL